MNDKLEFYSQIDQIISKLESKRSVSHVSLKRYPFRVDRSEIPPTLFQTHNQNLAETSFSGAENLASVEKPMPAKPRVTKSRSRPLHRVKQKPVPETFTHKPEINKNSRLIDRMLRNSENRWDELYSLHSKRRPETKENDISECTFRPSILQKCKSDDPRRIHERLQSWGKFKEEKLNSMRSSVVDKSLDECTFAPVINRDHQGH